MANEGSVAVKAAALRGHRAQGRGSLVSAGKAAATGPACEGTGDGISSPGAQHHPALTSPSLLGRSEAPPAPPVPLGSPSLPPFSLLPPLSQQQTPGDKYSSPTTRRPPRWDAGPSRDISQSYPE